MSILVVSVSHKTMPMDTLSRLAMDADTSVKLGAALTASDYVDEAVVLSTCNRTELYAAVTRFHGALDDITAQLAALTGVAATSISQGCAVYFDEGAVAHAFNVAAGLDSLVVGESQILGQVRAALTIAQQAGTVDTVLNSLFQQGIRVGKRVQTETPIGAAGRSLVSSALAELTTEIGPLDGRRVVVLGAGSMASLAARTVARDGALVSVVNRTPDRAEHLATAIGGRSFGLTELDVALAQADVVIGCTASRDVLLSAERLAGTPVRGVIDIALPADVEEEVGTRLPLINLTRLLSAQQPGTEGVAPTGEVDLARELVAGEVSDFLGLRRAAQVAPTVIALRSMASEVVSAELTRLDARLPTLDEHQRDEVKRTVRRVVEKLLHHPTVRIQAHVGEPESVDYAAALRELFALDPQAVAAVMSADLRR